MERKELELFSPQEFTTTLQYLNNKINQIQAQIDVLSAEQTNERVSYIKTRDLWYNELAALVQYASRQANWEGELKPIFQREITGRDPDFYKNILRASLVEEGENDPIKAQQIKGKSHEQIVRERVENLRKRMQVVVAIDANLAQADKKGQLRARHSKILEALPRNRSTVIRYVNILLTSLASPGYSILDLEKDLEGLTNFSRQEINPFFGLDFIVKAKPENLVLIDRAVQEKIKILSERSGFSDEKINEMVTAYLVGDEEKISTEEMAYVQEIQDVATFETRKNNIVMALSLRRAIVGKLKSEIQRFIDELPNMKIEDLPHNRNELIALNTILKNIILPEEAQVFSHLFDQYVATLAHEQYEQTQLKATKTALSRFYGALSVFLLRYERQLADFPQEDR